MTFYGMEMQEEIHLVRKASGGTRLQTPTSVQELLVHISEAETGRKCKPSSCSDILSATQLSRNRKLETRKLLVAR